MWFICLKSGKHNLNGSRHWENTIVNVSDFSFSLRCEVCWKERLAVSQKDVHFLIMLFHWLLPIVNLRLAENIWDNGWRLYRALVYFPAQSLWKCTSAVLAFPCCLERISSMCFALEVICCFAVYAHKQRLPLHLNIESAVVPDEAITEGCRFYLSTSASQSTECCWPPKAVC